MDTKLPAMTLIETLVVIVIVAILLSLGLGTLTALRNRLTVKNAASEIVQNLSSVRNNARNSVLIGKTSGDLANIQAAEKLDYYVVKFENGTYYRGTCDDLVNLTCEFDSGELKGSAYGIVKITPEDDACNTVLFNLSTGEFTLGRTQGQTVVINNNLESCLFTLEHSQTPFVKTQLEVDKTNQDFTIT